MRDDLPAVPSAGVHIPALDGLRGLAVLTVVVLHFTILKPQSGVESLFYQVASSGWVGVDLFFVLSGFLITGILLDTKRRKNFFKNFYIRRTLRIFPLYYAYLVLIFWIVPLFRPAPDEPYHVWIWGYLSNVLHAQVGWEGMPAHTTHLWSLAVEEQFYLLWPLIVYLVDEEQLIRICVGCFLLAIATRIGFFLATQGGASGYLLLPARVDSLAAGSLVAVAIRNSAMVPLLLRSVRPVAIGSGGVLLAICAWSSMTAPSEAFLPALSLPVQTLGYPAIALLSAAGMVKVMTARSGSLPNRFFTAAPMLSLGKYSYAIYLFHIPLRNLVRNHVDRVGSLPAWFGSQMFAQLLLIAAALVATYLGALLSWHTFEKHFLALKDRLAPNRPGRDVVAPLPDPGAAPESEPHGLPTTLGAGAVPSHSG